MSRVLQLGPTEWPAQRPFTNPALVEQDRRVLIRLIRDLHAAPAGSGIDQLGVRRDRLITTAAGRAYRGAAVTIVGFFGERLEDGCRDIADQVEAINAEMIAAFDEFPLVLGYVSRMLADDFNYANLVVLAGVDGIAQWRDIPSHITAVMELAPHFYSSVRIYNGCLPGGLADADRIQLNVVKYWDYGDTDVWQAMRRLDVT